MGFLFEKNYCAISKKLIEKGDNVVAFPAFACSPGTPEDVCCEAIALRDEFEKWGHKQRVVELSADSERLSFYFSRTCPLVGENEDFLIAAILIENKFRLVFLQQVYILEIAASDWRQFCEQILNDSDAGVYTGISPGFTWARDASGINICKQFFHYQNCIHLSWTEWAGLQAMLADYQDLQ